jgi:hypothetical protein|nr:MAG TPA: type I neck protein [Caudoviricetes sp.]
MGWGKCEFSQLKKLADNVQALNDGVANEFTKDIANEIAMRLLRRIKQKTPVKEGTLRNGWAIGQITQKGNSYTIEIINPVEYASYVEYGHRQTPGRFVPAIGKKLKKSWVKGRFMMTLSFKEIEQLTPSIVSAKVWEELKRCFNVK